MNELAINKRCGKLKDWCFKMPNIFILPPLWAIKIRNQKMTDNRKINLLGEIYLNFKRSKIAYDNYIKEGNIFMHAKILKECNLKIRNILLENAFILSENLQNDAIDLISHYDIWVEKWNDLKQKENPKLDDVFIFQNEFRFPKEAEKRLKEEFYKIKKDY